MIKIWGKINRQAAKSYQLRVNDAMSKSSEDKQLEYVSSQKYSKSIWDIIKNTTAQVGPLRKSVQSPGYKKISYQKILA